MSKISDLTPDAQNAKAHNPRNVGMIVNALHEVGAARSIVIDEDGNILAGNATIEAAAEAGIENLQIVEADGETIVAVRRTGLTDAQKTRLKYFDNRTAELADWNPDVILADLEAGVDLDDIFTDIELEDFGWEPDKAEDPGADMDKADELQEKWGVKRGDLFVIPSQSVEGKSHRILCGDSTDAEDVAKLMGEERARLFATDPPYGCDAGNIGFTAQRDDIEAITKDDLEGKDMQVFLESVFACWLPFLLDDCAWYLWHPMLTQGYFAAAAAAAAADLIIHRQIIWVKEQFIFGRGDYHWQHELCFYGWRKGNRPRFLGERNQSSVWRIAWGEKRSEVGHPTAKPPELFVIPMRNHLEHGEICAEPFLGSGSQIVAAEQTGRIAFGSEICEKYVAVCLERLQGLGLSPELDE